MARKPRGDRRAVSIDSGLVDRLDREADRRVVSPRLLVEYAVEHALERWEAQDVGALRDALKQPPDEHGPA